MDRPKTENEEFNDMQSQRYDKFQPELEIYNPEKLKEEPTSRQINVISLMSAGPRKSENLETELGEDVIGFFSMKDATYFWVLDGTSDSAGIILQDGTHCFSSRVLAQVLGYQILISLEKNKGNLQNILENSIAETIDILTKLVQGTNRDLKDKINETIINVGPLAISTTILFGKFSNNGNLEILNLGDSDCLTFQIYNESNLKHIEFFKIEPNNRLFFILYQAEEQFHIRTNKYEEKISTQSISSVDSIVAFSDGVNTSKSALKTRPEYALKVISAIDQRSFDDKSLIWLKRS